MASYPPPLSPSGPPSYGYDAKQQRRMLKDQAKIQRAVMREQERLQQQHLRSLRRGSILPPLVILSVGLFVLVDRTGHLATQNLAVHYNHLWPLALVLAGAVLLMEWQIDQHRLRPAGTSVRRGATSGVLLLVLLLGAAGAYLNSGNARIPFNIQGFNVTPDNLEEVFGERHDRDEQINRDLVPGTALSIDNPRGDVTVIGRQGESGVHITINKQVYSNSDAAADAKALALSPVVSTLNGVMQITVPRQAGSRADLILTIPESSQATINAVQGDIHVSGLLAPVFATEEHGDVQIDQVTGPVVAHLGRNDSSFTASNIKGDVELKGHAEDLSLSRIEGNVTLEGDFYGDTHLEQINGPIAFHTNRTQLSLARLAGQLDISPDEDLTGSQIVGPVTLTTRSRNVSLDRVAGELTISNSNGTVDVTHASPLSSVRIENRNGAVSLTLPPDSAFLVDADAQDGHTSNDFSLVATRSGNLEALRGSVGDGKVRINLKTTHDNVEIHKGEVSAPEAAPVTKRP